MPVAVRDLANLAQVWNQVYFKTIPLKYTVILSVISVTAYLQLNIWENQPQFKLRYGWFIINSFMTRIDAAQILSRKISCIVELLIH